MSSSNIVLLWLEAAREGDEDALTQIWQRFSARMTTFCARWLRQASTPAVFDEDDVAVSAFDTFRRALRDGQFSELRGSDDLWRLLATITIRKARDHIQSQQAEKRGGRETIVSLDESGVGNQPTVDPTPEMAAMMTDECRRLLTKLNDPELETVVLLKVDGYSNEEIAKELGYSRRTIQRMIDLIKQRWKTETERSRQDDRD